jgi:uncharacterized Zn finger protein
MNTDHRRQTMTVTLSNFKQEIDPEILSRGRRYFTNGHVIDLDEVTDGNWSAIVEGTESYQVIITQKGNGDLSTQCTCPYDWGPVCKHIAAVLHAIEKTLEEEKEDKLHQPRKKRKTRHDKVHDALKRMAHEELVELLTELADQDRQIALLVLARFSDDATGKKACIRLVKDALNMGKSQHGFIDYYGSGRAARGVQDILQRADADLDQGRANNAVPVYQAVIETVVPAISYADDSNGELGDCISFALDGLSEAAQTLPLEEQNRLFEYCLLEAQHERYSGWDWGWDLAQIGADLVKTTAQRQQLSNVLDKMATSHQDEEEIQQRWRKYEVERAEMIKLSVIERLDDEETLFKFLNDRVDMYKFREKLVELHIDHGHLDEARHLCNEWLACPDSHLRRVKIVFQALLLKIAQAEKNQEDIIRLAETLFFETGNFEYYTLLKEAIQGDWIAFRKKVLEQAVKHFRHYDLVPEIFVREKMWHELLNHAKKSSRYTVNQYRDYLEPRFPAEVAAIYEQIVWDLMSEKVNRKGYREACRYIRRMFKLEHSVRAKALIEALQDKYRNRPALLDELKKI